jgi:capsular exopolysaccharide synthesis family protein
VKGTEVYMQYNNFGELYIDLKELLIILLKKIWIIIACGILCALCAGIISKFIMIPTYTSSTKLYVINREDKETTTFSDLQTSTQLTMDYKILVLSRPVIDQVIQNLKLKIAQKQLISLIDVYNPANTRILQISVNNSDPLLAKQLADTVAEVSAERMVAIMEMEKANIVEPANLPVEPSGPNIRKNTLVAGLSGFVLSAFIILLIFIMNDSIKCTDDIERYLGISTLGSIPFETLKGNIKLPGKKKRRRNKGLQEGMDNFRDIQTERSDISFSSREAYKTLRTNIQFCGKEIKTICVTSCMPNEGKTVVSFRLASSLAEGGKKVLFIDADLRKSVIIGMLKIDSAIFGLSQYLSGMNSLEEVINKTKVDNLDIIFTGPIPPNPSELLGSDMFNELISEQRNKYDYIIIDTPPLGIVIDSANVAEACDGVLMVIESNNVSYKFVQQVLKQLVKSKCRVLGAVLNKIDMKQHGYYGNGYGKFYGNYKYQD